MRFRTTGTIRYDVKRQFLSLGDFVQSRFLDGGNMNKNIFFVLRRFDKSITFFVIKPFYCSV